MDNPCFSGWHWLNLEDGTRRPFRCGGWRCPRCGPGKRKRLSKVFAAMAAKYKMCYLWTMTLPGKGTALRGRAHASREAIGPMWNRIRNALEYQVGKMTFIAVPEPQRDGTAHLHFITNRFIPKGVMDEIWGRAGGGFTWVERADVHRAGKYIAKYLGKHWERAAPWDERLTKYDDEGRELRVRPWRPWRRYWLATNLVIFKRHPQDDRLMLVYAEHWEWCEICDNGGDDTWRAPPP